MCNLYHYNMQQDKYQKSRVFQIRHRTCNNIYIEKKGHKCCDQFKENIGAIRPNTDGSNFAKHVSETDHEYDAIHEIMDIAKLLENVHYWMYMKETMSVCI